MIFNIIIIGIGILGISLFMVGGAIKKDYNKRIEECTEKVEGEIIEIIKEDMSSSNDEMYRYSWFPIVKYKVEEKEIKKRFNLGNAEPKYEKGQKVVICYNPQRVEEFYILGENVQKTIGKVFTMIGGLFLVIDVLMGIVFAFI